MSNPVVFYQDNNSCNPLRIPILNCINFSIIISTRQSGGIIYWGDSSKDITTFTRNTDFTISSGLVRSHLYENTHTGNARVCLNDGLKDIYSYRFTSGVIGSDGLQQYNIDDVGIFLNQMTNLYSFQLDIYAYGIDSRRPIIKGDLANFPISVQRVLVRAVDVKSRSTDLYFNFNSLSPNSMLKWFSKVNGTGTSNMNALRFLGDISKIPEHCNYFFIASGDSINTSSSIKYTKGKQWSSTFDTLQIPIVLTTLELDNLLIDLNDSITTAVGGRLIYLRGTRSILSDSAVLGLQNKGFTVTIIA